MSAVEMVIAHYRARLAREATPLEESFWQGLDEQATLAALEVEYADLLDLLDSARKYDAEADAWRVLRAPEAEPAFDWSALGGDRLKKWGAGK